MSMTQQTLNGSDVQDFSLPTQRNGDDPYVVEIVTRWEAVEIRPGGWVRIQIWGREAGSEFSDESPGFLISDEWHQLPRPGADPPEEAAEVA